MVIKIENWYGRTGNNIQQCAVGILIAIKKKNKFETISSEIIKPFKLDFGKSLKNIKTSFFWYGNYDSPNIPTFKVYKDIFNICQKYIIKNLGVSSVKLSDKTLVIHIRSGDIFRGKGAHSDYVQNPYIYYLHLIELYEEVIVVTQPDEKNPILKKLRKNPKVKIQSKSISEDFATLIAAKNLATSGVGTFAIAAAMCSRNLQNLYCSNKILRRHLNYHMLSNTNINIYICELKKYINIGDWTNCRSQRDLMINYKGIINFKKYRKNNFNLIFISLITDVELIIMQSKKNFLSYLKRSRKVIKKKLRKMKEKIFTK